MSGTITLIAQTSETNSTNPVPSRQVTAEDIPALSELYFQAYASSPAAMSEEDAGKIIQGVFDGEYGPLYSYGIKALKRFKPDWFLKASLSLVPSSRTNRRSALCSSKSTEMCRSDVTRFPRRAWARASLLAQGRSLTFVA